MPFQGVSILKHCHLRYLTQFGMIIGYSQTLKKPFPVSPMPGPDYNLHYAISTIETDPDNARAMNTIRISTGWGEFHNF